MPFDGTMDLPPETPLYDDTFEGEALTLGSYWRSIEEEYRTLFAVEDALARGHLDAATQERLQAKVAAIRDRDDGDLGVLQWTVENAVPLARLAKLEAQLWRIRVATPAREGIPPEVVVLPPEPDASATVPMVAVTSTSSGEHREPLEASRPAPPAATVRACNDSEHQRRAVLSRWDKDNERPTRQAVAAMRERGPMTPPEVALAVCIKLRYAYKLLRRMVVRGEAVNPRFGVYALPDTPVPAEKLPSEVARGTGRSERRMATMRAERATTATPATTPDADACNGKDDCDDGDACTADTSDEVAKQETQPLSVTIAEVSTSAPDVAAPNGLESTEPHDGDAADHSNAPTPTTATKRRQRARPWTTEDDAELRRLAPTGATRKVAAALDRDWKDVSQRAEALCVFFKRHRDFFRQVAQKDEERVHDFESGESSLCGLVVEDVSARFDCVRRGRRTSEAECMACFTDAHRRGHLSKPADRQHVAWQCAQGAALRLRYAFELPPTQGTIEALLDYSTLSPACPEHKRACRALGV